MYISIRLDELKGCNGQLIQFNSTVGIDVNVDENIDLQKARQFKVELEDFINERLNGIIEREPIEEEVKEESKEDEKEISFAESCRRDFISRLKECLKRNPEHSEREMMKALIDDYENGNWCFNGVNRQVVQEG